MGMLYDDDPKSYKIKVSQELGLTEQIPNSHKAVFLRAAYLAVLEYENRQLNGKNGTRNGFTGRPGTRDNILSLVPCAHSIKLLHRCSQLLIGDYDASLSDGEQIDLVRDWLDENG